MDAKQAQAFWKRFDEAADNTDTADGRSQVLAVRLQTELINSKLSFIEHHLAELVKATYALANAKKS